MAGRGLLMAGLFSGKELATGLLLRAIRKLPDRPVQCQDLFPSAHASQKRHWIGWLAEYHGPGYYHRQSFGRDARFAYNHTQCPAMLLWLAGRVGVRAQLIATAANDAIGHRNKASQCAAIR